MISAFIDVPGMLIPHLDCALIRLGYLYPEVQWVFRSESKQLEAVSSGASGSETLRKEALFQLYREKIHQDTLEIRTRLYDAV